MQLVAANGCPFSTSGAASINSVYSSALGLTQGQCYQNLPRKSSQLQVSGPRAPPPLLKVPLLG